MHETVVSSNKI